MDNARNIPCKLLKYPTDQRFAEDIRKFQGCPSVAVTEGGRIFLGWYSGGTKEPHIENYNLLVKSDNGKDFGEPVLVIPSDEEKLVHALDIQLWISPRGALYVFWVQNNVTKSVDGVRPDLPPDCPWVSVGGYDFGDFRHALWLTVCEEPDADELSFSEPRCIGTGFLRCKPTVLDSGRWLLFNYDQLNDRYGYSITDDEGKTFVRRYGAQKIPTSFDEGMAYQRNDGSIRMLARAHGGKIAESISYDLGESFSTATLTDITSPDTRFYVSRTPSGRIILVNNDFDVKRRNTSVYLSEDDGATWKYKRTVDPRATSYPDVDFHNGRIYLTYDRERTGEREILLLDFTEEDVMNESYVFTPVIVSKPKMK